MTGSLEGVRVLDLTSGSFGYAGRLFAGFGADVVKVEPPEGDVLRTWPPFPQDQPDIETSARHLHLNAAKRSITLDLDAESGQALLRDLVRHADILIESYPPGYLAERGCAYDDLIAVRPDLVMASITHFGQDGPYGGFAGAEIVDMALGGYLKLTGDSDREPVKCYDDMTLQHASLHAAVACIGGLVRRDATGEGDYYDVSAMDAAVTLNGGAVQMYHFSGHMLPRTGARLLSANPRYAYPSTIRPCADGYVHAHSNNRHFDLLAALIPGVGLEELLETPMGNADLIDAKMDPWLAERTKHEIVQLAQELRLPFTEVFTPEEILSDPHLEERGFLVDLQHPKAPAGMRQPGAAATMTATPWHSERAPLLGEHTNEILEGLLGLDADARQASGALTSAGTLTPAETLTPALSQNGRGGRRFVGSDRMTRPLEGYRILELTNAVAGPVAGYVLADLGADVIKIEAPNGRTAQQAAAPPAMEGAPDRPWNRVPNFNELHRGKRHMSLDLSRPEGREIFLRLVPLADAVVENFSPRVLGNLGIDYPNLQAAREDIILTSMPAFGKTGPYAERASYGPGIDAMSGLSHLTGYPDRGPGKPAQFYCDYHAGLTAAFATVAALRHRDRTGEGQYIELAMLEGEMQLIAPALMDVVMNGRVQSRMGNRHAWHAPQGVYRCEGPDRWVAVSVQSEEQWRAFATVVGGNALASDARYASAEARRERHEELDTLITAWSEQRSDYDAMHALQSVGVPAGAVLDCEQVMADPHLLHRELLMWQDHPEAGRFPHTRLAWRSRSGTHGPSGPAPTFGDGNPYALRELLGEPPEVEAAMLDAGVLAVEPRG